MAQVFITCNSTNSSLAVNKVTSTYTASSFGMFRILVLALVFSWLKFQVAAQNATTTSLNCTAQTAIVQTKLKFQPELWNLTVYGTCTTTGNSITCTFDYYPIVATYESACLNANGTFYTENLKASCSSNGYSATSTFTYLPICVGQSCTEAEVNNELQELAANLTQISNKLTNAQCTFVFSTSAASTTKSFYLLITTSAFSILSIFLIFYSF